MAIKIKSANGLGLTGGRFGLSPSAQEVEILCDTEAEITALGETVDDGTVQVKPTPGSVAYTPDLTVMYTLSPSGVWTKTV